MEKIGRYEILAELGKGAMGVVYKATDPNIGRTVAIKTLRLDLHGTESEEMLARFKNEARAAGVMNHANIITIYDAGEQEGMFYITMEFIEGQTLQALLKENKTVPVERATGIVRQVCAGLDYAHARGIVHRDIKPANIMITADGTVKIMDFGIAKSGGSGMTSTGQVVGTPNYMSPEQVKGLPLDGRTDLFSLGVVLYEMLTGMRPFGGDNVTTIIYKIVNETPAAPCELVQTMHPGLSDVVMKALAKLPQERFATGAGFARAVQEYQSFKPEAALAGATIRLGCNAGLPSSRLPSAAQTPTAAVRVETALTAKPAIKPDPAANLKLAVKAPPPPNRTVSSARVAERSPATPKTGSVASIAAMVVLVTLAVGAYVQSHRAALRAADMTSTSTSASSDVEKPTAAKAKSSKQRSAAKEEVAASTTPDEQSAPPAAIPAGDLQISSTPFGASVKIDGKTDPDWVTPFAARKLKPGRHSVSFALDGYQPDTRDVEVVAGTKLPLYVQLQVAQGLLSLNSDPPGAAIYVDGLDSGQVTPSRMTVNAGQHRIALRKDGFKPKITYADVTAGATFNFAPALIAADAAAAEQLTTSASSGQGPNPFRRLRRFFGRDPAEIGMLEIRTRPRGAEVRLGDSSAPSRTPARFAVSPGSYTLTLSLPGYKSITRSVQIERGKMTGIEEIFEPQ